MPHIICISQKKNTCKKENLDYDVILEHPLRPKENKKNNPPKKKPTLLIIYKHYEYQLVK